MTTPTDDALLRVEAALEKMTPEPWTEEPVSGDGWGIGREGNEVLVANVNFTRAGAWDEPTMDDIEASRANLDGIITLRNDAPALCQELRELRQEMESFDESWTCPECASYSVSEFAYKDDCGFMRCNDCGYQGQPGEEFPTVRRVREELRRLREENAALRDAAADAWERAVRDYAVWRDGEQWVGMGRPLASVLAKNPYRERLAAREDGDAAQPTEER